MVLKNGDQQQGKGEVGEAGREQSHSSTWRKGGRRLRRGKLGEEQGPCHAGENQLGEVNPAGQSGKSLGPIFINPIILRQINLKILMSSEENAYCCVSAEF